MMNTDTDTAFGKKYHWKWEVEKLGSIVFSGGGEEFINIITNIM